MNIAVSPRPRATPIACPTAPRPRAAGRARPRHPRRRRGPARRPRPRGRRSGPAPPSATAPGAGRWPSSTRSRRAACGRSTCRGPMAGRGCPTGPWPQVIAIISAADPSIGQIAQNHLGIVAAIRHGLGRGPAGAAVRPACCAGTRFGNAFSEIGTPRAADFKTRFVDDGDHVVVHGTQVLRHRGAARPPRAHRGPRWRGPGLVRHRASATRPA